MNRQIQDKDPVVEQRLKELNALLLPLEQQVDKQFTKPQRPVIFIVGCPRTGSTLLAQLMATSGLFGYVNNFVARFWQTPLIGLKIAEALGFVGVDSRFESHFGRTMGWNEPHEFGYFWDRWFRYGDTAKVSAENLNNIDRSELRRAVASIESAFAGPLFFKNQNKYSLQIDFLADVLETSVFVWVAREAPFQQQSVLLTRKSKFGDLNTWWTMKPEEYDELKHLSPFEQVAGQTHFLSRAIAKSLESLDESRCFRLNYETICRDPRRAVHSVAQFAGIESTLDSALSPLPEKLTPTNVQRLPDDQWQELESACHKFELL